ncbi:MAG: HepT-like ribonuclease domain-containing protein [Desulfobulbia bacterium]
MATEVLEVIGEATKALSEETPRMYSNVPWEGMAGMRDILIHQYMGVDLEIVWDVSQTKLEDLRSQIQSLLDGPQDNSDAEHGS